MVSNVPFIIFKNCNSSIPHNTINGIIKKKIIDLKFSLQIK